MALDVARCKALGRLDVIAGSAIALLLKERPSSELGRALSRRYHEVQAELTAARAQYERAVGGVG